MQEKNHNKRIIFTIVFAILAIVFAYVFAVVYFFYISPNDISMRVRIFPMLSTEGIAEQYEEAIVELTFEAQTNELDEEKTSVTVHGVNVREDGYVIASYYEFDYYSVGTISAIANNGGVYGAEVIFSDATFNLTVIKLTSSSGREVSLPYVSIYSGSVSEGTNLISIEFGTDNYGNDVTYVVEGSAYGQTLTAYATTNSASVDFDGYSGVEYIIEECFVYETADDEETYNSLIFDRYGRFVGLFSSYSTTSYFGFATSVSSINSVFDAVVANYETNQAAYTSDLVDAFKGLDANEVYCHSEMGNKDVSGNLLFYYNGESHTFTTNMTNLLNSAYQDYENDAFQWFYLVEDFEFSGQTIAADSVLTEIEVNGKSTTITTHNALVAFLYGLKTGDKVKIYYYSELDEDAQIASIEFTL